MKRESGRDGNSKCRATGIKHRLKVSCFGEISAVRLNRGARYQK